MSLKIAFHGGKCCGIKIIHGFDDPTTLEPSIKKKAEVNNDIYGHNVRSDVNFYTDHAPVESTVDRLDRYIRYLERRRPKGIIEVALAQSQRKYGFYHQVETFGKILEDRDFRLVNKCLNSNSGNVVYVYHRNCGEVPQMPPEKKEEDNNA